MLRGLLFFAKLAIVVVAAVVVASAPGRVSVQWFGYQIDTSVGILLLAVALVTVVVTVTYRYWRLLIGTPGALGRRFGEGRRRRGYKALTLGMVAVAAGDRDEAKRWARKAEVLLEEPPLTLLLSAQAAQLNGDDRAAKRYFEAMLENEETRFMGLRGCLMQAMREGDKAAALDYARKAQMMRPKTPWVLNTMIELSEALGDYSGAERAIQQATRNKALTAAEGTRQRAVVLLEQALQEQAAGHQESARKRAREALKLAPALVPATVLLAEILIAGGRTREAARVLERAWSALPHPELVRTYKATQQDKDELTWLSRLKKLVAGAPDHQESLLALAEAALEAKLWGEARRHLAAAAKESPSERVCRLMARIEEAEHGDAEQARSWLMRAVGAPRDAAWICDSCGAIAASWQPHCGACDAFDSLTWRRPVQVAPEAQLGDETVIEDTPVLAAPETRPGRQAGAPLTPVAGK